MAAEIEDSILNKSKRKGETKMTKEQANSACVGACEVSQFFRSECTPVFSKRLRTCQATVYAYENEKGRVYILKSYNTIVAAIGASGRCYDFLRYVYGYTATSAQHISKFFKDYASANAERLTYRA